MIKIKTINKERLKKLNNYLEQIPEEKQEAILIGLEMVAALYNPNSQKNQIRSLSNDNNFTT